MTDSRYLADVAGDPLPLEGRVALPGVPEDISYPEGWYAEHQGPFTTIAPERVEVRKWFAGGELETPLVFFEVETFGFLRGMGLQEEDPSIEDLLDFTSSTFGWEEIRDRVRLTLFDGEGIQIRGRDPRGDFLGIVGELPGERSIFILVIAPTGRALDELMVTWRAMVGTLQAPTARGLPGRVDVAAGPPHRSHRPARSGRAGL